MNGQIIDIKGKDVVVAYHPIMGEPRLGDALLVTDRGSSSDVRGVVIQVLGYDAARYPGDQEAALAELLEAVVADRHEIVRGEPAMVDLKEIKLLRCKIKKTVRDGEWLPWDGRIPTRNVRIRPLGGDEILDRVLPKPQFPITVATYDGVKAPFDARLLDKVNALVGIKGSGKSHASKLMLNGLRGHGAPCWVFDMNREFADLPGAEVLRLGDNFQVSLAEVGFPFLMAIIEEMGPLQDVSRGAFEQMGRRLIEEEVRRTQFATIEYLLAMAEHDRFHNNEMVNRAIETRLRMVSHAGVFARTAATETLAARSRRLTAAGGFLVFDLAELPVGRLRALTRGLNRRLEGICVEERRGGGYAYPFVIFEEAHFYASPEEILNLITRGRHLGLTVFFVTNSPAELPEVVFRQVDNLIVTGLSHSADLRTIGKCSLSEEDTLQSLAVALGPTQALVVGRITANFPLVVEVLPLPEGFPATGATRSFWAA
jgi:uncharacterized protein DUF87